MSASKRCEDQRRHLRVPVRWACAVTSDDAEESCIMLDVSPSGALIQAPVPYAVDARLAVSTGLGGAFSGRVAWHRGSFAGIAFSPVVPDFLASEGR